MSSFLFIADVPPNTAFPGSGEPEHSPKWRSFVAASERIAQPASSAKRIGECTWQIQSSGAWRTLSSLASAAEAESISYSVLLIEGAITELTSS